MVRGIQLKFPFVHYGTAGAYQLFPIIREAVCRVEGVGLKVLFISADGTSANRKFFRMYRDPIETSRLPAYKTLYPLANELRPIIFISDPSYLLKTARHCLSHSDFDGTRPMLVGIHHAIWVLKIMCVFSEKLSILSLEACGGFVYKAFRYGKSLNLVPKLKLEYVKQTAYACMHVDLAVK